MAQVIHANATFLGASALVVRMLLESPDQMRAAIAHLDAALRYKSVDCVDPVLDQWVGLLRVDLMPGFFQDAQIRFLGRGRAALLG